MSVRIFNNKRNKNFFTKTTRVTAPVPPAPTAPVVKEEPKPVEDEATKKAMEKAEKVIEEAKKKVKEQAPEIVETPVVVTPEPPKEETEVPAKEEEKEEPAEEEEKEEAVEEKDAPEEKPVVSFREAGIRSPKIINKLVELGIESANELAVQDVEELFDKMPPKYIKKDTLDGYIERCKKATE
jgi:hypothetical protein